MNLLFEYTFPDSNPKTLEDVMIASGQDLHFIGFTKCQASLAPGSDPVSGTGIGSLNELNAKSIGLQFFPNSITLTPGAGSNWKILVYME